MFFNLIELSRCSPAKELCSANPADFGREMDSLSKLTKDSPYWVHMNLSQPLTGFQDGSRHSLTVKGLDFIVCKINYVVKPRIFELHLSENAAKALAKGIVAGSLSLLIYVVVVVLTSPSLVPLAAIRIGFEVNSNVMLGVSLGTGVQVFLSSYSRLMGCRLGTGRGFVSAASGGTAFSSFLSFFSLVPLGCCGTWLYIVSFLPSIVGGALSASIIQYSRPLSYVGLALVWGFVLLFTVKLARQLKEQKLIEEARGTDRPEEKRIRRGPY